MRNFNLLIVTLSPFCLVLGHHSVYTITECCVEKTHCTTKRCTLPALRLGYVGSVLQKSVLFVIQCAESGPLLQYVYARSCCFLVSV